MTGILTEGAIIRLASILRTIEGSGTGTVTLGFDGIAAEWVVGCEFGQEALDSPMAAGAIYGAGRTLEEALDAS